MHVLITNLTLEGPTGPGTFVRDLARGLSRRGHRVTVYSPRTGPLAEEIRAAGTEVVDSLREVGDPPDVVHGHHHPVTVEALLAFPSVPALFVCRDRLSRNDVPPLHPRVLRYVAVDGAGVERLRAYGIPDERCVLVPDAVDLSRFLPREPLPSRPRRALVYDNDAGALLDVDPLRTACAQSGIGLDVAGEGCGRISWDPERFLPGFDLVFAKSRGALEALAVGCSVILCGARGLGEAVTFASFPRMRAWGFGPRLLTRRVEAVSALSEIARYDPSDAAAVRDLVRTEAGLDRALSRYEALYQDLIQAPPSPGCADEELRRYLGRQLGAALEVKDRPDRFATEPLAGPSLGALELAWSRRPERARPGERLDVRVTLANRGAGRVSSDPPWPIHLSYRWFDRETGTVEVLDGLRSPILPALGLDQRGSFRVDVEAPGRPGSFRLRVTLVQEAVAWLDDRAPHLGLDADVEVSGPPVP